MKPRRETLVQLEDTDQMTTGQKPGLSQTATSKKEQSMTDTNRPAETPNDDLTERTRALLASLSPQQVEELMNILKTATTGQQVPASTQPPAPTPAFMASHLTEVATRLEDYFTVLTEAGEDDPLDMVCVAFDDYMRALVGREDMGADWGPLENCPELEQPSDRLSLVDAGLLAELKDDKGELTGFVFPLLACELDA